MAYKPDKKDKLILGILREHGDYTTRQIAKKTLLPITTIHKRIKRLKKEKIIKRFTVELDYNRVDKGLLTYILINVNLAQLKQMKKSQYDMAKELNKFDFVHRVDIVTGGSDLVAVIRVRDMDEFDKVLLGKIQLIEGIDNTRSLMVIHAGRER